MSRRKAEKNARILIIALCVSVPVILAAYAIEHPLSFIAIFLIVVFLVAVGFGIYVVYKRLQAQGEKAVRHRQMAPIQTLPQMKFLSPREFEVWAGALFEHTGYRATVTAQSNDGGIDIILQKKGEVAAVQVKQYSARAVTRPDIQRFFGAAQGYNKKIFVTTSDYSPGARDYGAKYGIELINGEELQALAKKFLGADYQEKALFGSVLNRT